MEVSFQKPLIGVCVSFFEDVNCLSICLDSVLSNNKLRDYVKILCLDGKYLGYPITYDLSQDGSREVVKEFAERYPGRVELYDYPNLQERFKRQCYVNIAAEQNIPFIIILDSDEYIQCKYPARLIEELAIIELQWKESNIDFPDSYQTKIGNVMSVKCIDLDGEGIPSQIMARPRLWYRPEDMHYTSKHYWFARRDEMLKENFSLSDILNSRYKSLHLENLVIWHSHECRSTDRENRRIHYETKELPKLEDDNIKRKEKIG